MLYRAYTGVCALFFAAEWAAYWAILIKNTGENCVKTQNMEKRGKAVAFFFLRAKIKIDTEFRTKSAGGFCAFYSYLESTRAILGYGMTITGAERPPGSFVRLTSP